MNTAIRLADPPGATLFILDKLGWYCDVVNMYIRQRQNHIVHEIMVIKTEESLNHCDANTFCGS